MSNYRDTLNLPQTAFPMKANLANREPNMLKKWQQQDLYHRRLQQRQDRDTYILHDGPPYANARPHLGTAINKITKDIIIKSKFLSGFNTPYVPGWDCHGLPIELNVEKKKGKAGHKLSFPEFRAACRAYATTQVDLQRDDFVRMGVLAEWEKPYLTMDYAYEAGVVRGLIPMLKRGHLRRGQKPIYWCPDCASALAEAEIEYKDKISPAIDVAFNVVDVAKVLAAFNCDHPLKDVAVAIWTTTPWTIPANQAVSLNAELPYVLLHHQATTIIIAEALLPAVVERFGWQDYEVLATTAGKNLESIKLQHPLNGKEVPIILGDHVTTDAGTGCVHTAPAHGEDDYKVCQHYDIEVDSLVMSNSCFAPDVPVVGGQHVYKANPIVIEALEKTGNLLHNAELDHSYPHCWRHKKPVIFRATLQWFIALDAAGLRQQALTEITKATWVPAWGEKRIHNMVASRPDWCISRQRCWGSPLALLVHKETGELHPKMPDLLEDIATAIEEQGSEAWFASSVEDWLSEDADKYEKIHDTLDVWFDAGMSHSCVLDARPELHVPADLYFEGSDQHRGWFQSSLLSSVAMRGHAPYKSVLTHGYVVDAKGHKMSKSVGNVVAPSEVVQKYGADILRLWAASANVQEDINVSDEILKRNADAYRRVRNTARFLLSNLADFAPATNACSTAELLPFDQWLVHAAYKQQRAIIEAYDEYSIHTVSHLLINFCVNTLGGFFLDVLKDRMYTCAADSKARRSGQTAMYLVLQALVRWMAPILSYTADEIWENMPGAKSDSVFLEEWFDLSDFAQLRDFSAAEAARLLQLRDMSNKALEQKRAEDVVGGALDANITIYVDGDDYAMLAKLGDELRFLLLSSQASVQKFAERDAAAIDVDANVAVAVAAVTDAKCARCWQRRPEVGSIEGHNDICDRCVVNITDAAGETRQWV